MDVQAATPTLSSTTFTLPPPPAPAGASGSLPDAGSGAAVTLPGSSSAGSLPPPPSGSGSGTTADATPGLALLPPHGGTPSSSPSGTATLPGNVAKLYGAPANTTSVSFQPAAGSNEIVTVVTNTQTGKVVVQFPSETLVALAQFFQKLDNAGADNGAVVDKKV
jgi:hypothetical protein